LPAPSLLLPGDRFIVRQFSPVVTIGGGVVLDAAPIPRMPDREDFLQVLAAGNGEEILEARIARRQKEGVLISRLIAETGSTKTSIQTQLAKKIAQGRVMQIGETLLDLRALEALKLYVLSAVEHFHKANPLVSGINKEELRDQADTSAEIFAAVIAGLQREKKLDVAGDLVRLPGRGVVMQDVEAESKQQIEGAFASTGLKVPGLREVIAGLKVDKVRAQKIVTLLLKDKTLIKVSDELVFHRTALQELRRQMVSYKTRSTRIDVAQFKELTGVSRKYAIPLLEYLDREHVTRRVGDLREIL
jgi:selenocysteine-specific elongation factor